MIDKEYSMTGHEAAKIDTGYDVDYDEDTGSWCVFGLESGFAYTSGSSEEEANKELEQMERAKSVN